MDDDARAALVIFAVTMVVIFCLAYAYVASQEAQTPVASISFLESPDLRVRKQVLMPYHIKGSLLTGASTLLYVHNDGDHSTNVTINWYLMYQGMEEVTKWVDFKCSLNNSFIIFANETLDCAISANMNSTTPRDIINRIASAESPATNLVTIDFTTKVVIG